LVTFSAEVDAQMVELVVHCKVQWGVSGFSASRQNLLLRTDKLPLLTPPLVIPVVLGGLFPVHVGHHQIFHFEVSRLLHISPLRIERIAFATQRVPIRLHASGKGRWALNVFMKLPFGLLLLIFHCLYSLDLLFSIVNDYNHIIWTRLIGLHNLLWVSFFPLNILLVRPPLDRGRKVLLILWSSDTAEHFPLSVHICIFKITLRSLFFKRRILFRNDGVRVLLQLFCYRGPLLRKVFIIIILQRRNGEHGSLRLLSIYQHKLALLLNDPGLFTDAHLLPEL